MQVGVWAPTKRISKRNSTDNASWRGPNIEAGGKSAYNNVQVGGANIEAGGKSAYNNVQVGWDDEINFAKISFLSHSH
ncbi:hypothetical protein SAU400_03380 [Staphylococcus aureus]|nr:hypothetical protein SAU400_03380 [Staphylococcus aureus]